MIKSPCINVCILDKDNNFCLGCYRYKYEIFNWVTFSEKQKKILLSKIQKRSKINNKIKNNLFKKTAQNIMNKNLI